MPQRRRRRRTRGPQLLLALVAAITATLIVATLLRTAATDIAEAAFPPPATPSRSTTPTPKPASLDAARDALDDGPATISVIGDSTSNDGNEWVALWAQHLGQNHRVTVHRWLDGRYRPDPLTYGDQGPKVTIWNASQPGGSASWATDLVDAVQPDQPDLTILNLGKNNTRANIATQLDQLAAALDPDIPQVLILQNPSRGDRAKPDAATSRAAARWALEHNVPTIDAGAAITNPDRQLYDQIHPNETGSKLWADLVAEELG